MPTSIEPRPFVARATKAAAAAGFTNSCSPEVGRLLATICATKPASRVAESGAGYGVGTSWLHSGLGTGATLVTVDREPDCAEATAALFAGESRVKVLTGDWRALEAHAPFDPSAARPPMHDGAIDHLRVLYLTHHLLHAVEIVTGPGQAAILATRR